MLQVKLLRLMIEVAMRLSRTMEANELAVQVSASMKISLEQNLES
jgi:hypothetical protein